VAQIHLEGLVKKWPGGEHAVHGIDLQVADAEFLVLVGPSGCGKSTLLRLIAGLERTDAGRIVIGDADVTARAPQDRDLAMVFQSYALYPHMSVRDNLAYGLRVRGADAETIARRVRDAAESLGLERLLDRRPAQLSGGQRQRVALGRAIVRSPKAFLLDEPLSNLDPALRAQARAELRRLHRTLGATIVHVTHDQEEAMTLGDRIAVMRDGRIEQVDTPEAVYARPANTFVARFIGAPAMNLVPPSVTGIDGAAASVVGIRPHDVVLGGRSPLAGSVDLVEPRGHDAVVHLRLDDDAGTALVAVVGAPGPAPGARLPVALPHDRLHLFDANGDRLLTPDS
jgi:ABC-type sugar transport system ATPase subunit